MTERDAVPPGYKRTEVGVIPEGWEIKRFGDIVKIRNLKIFPSNVDLNTLCIELEHIEQNDGRLNGHSEARYSTSSKYLFYKGDVLFGRLRSYLRKYWLSDADGICSTEIWPFFTNPKIASNNFIFWVVQTNRFIDEASISYGTHMPRADWGVIQNLMIPYPLLPEQHAIAAALSDVDGLIGALDALIAKKRDMKQAAMQQLLTGRTRLPGFEGKWVTVKVGAIGILSKGRGIKRDDVSDNGLACIRYGELYTTYKNYILSPLSRIPQSVASDALPIKTGDLLFAGSGETAEEIGQCAAYLGTEQAYAGGDIIVLTPQGQNSIFLGHLMNHESVTNQKARMAQGDAVVHISTRSLSQIEVELPSIDEQLAISKLLLDMDVEIAALERRRDKVKEIKQGMMQQLLTGKVRLAC